MRTVFGVQGPVNGTVSISIYYLWTQREDNEWDPLISTLITKALLHPDIYNACISLKLGDLTSVYRHIER